MRAHLFKIGGRPYFGRVPHIQKNRAGSMRLRSCVAIICLSLMLYTLCQSFQPFWHQISKVCSLCWKDSTTVLGNLGPRSAVRCPRSVGL